MSNDRILDRIQKMLALAKDAAATEGERDNALRMAYATMAKYNLSEDDVDLHQRKEDDPREMTDAPGWSQIWAKNVYHIVGDLFFCKYFFGAKINATKCHHHYIGKTTNAITARYMSEYIIESILKEARTRFKHNLSPESRAFALGAVSKLRQRVNELRKAQEQEHEQSTGRALVLANLYESEKQANQLVLQQNGVNLTKSTRTSKAPNEGAYREGRKYGETISLNAQLGGSKDTSRRLK